MSLLTAAGMTAGSIEGAGSHFLGGKLLTVGGNNLSTEVSGTLADGGFGGGSGGALTKVGTGTLTLSGANTYTGATTVNAGTLLVNGSIAASSGLTVNAGATVGGDGTLPSTTINGTLAPGNSIGAITINGNLVLGAGSIYQVEVSPTAADRTNVTGIGDARRHRAADLRVRRLPVEHATRSSRRRAGARARSTACRP